MIEAGAVRGIASRWLTRKEFCLIGGAVVALLTLVLYTAVISPRPYYYTPVNDIEHDYYYNARLINAGLPPNGIHHPGTPIYYLGAAIQRLSDPDWGHAQRFFTLSHLVVVLLTAAGLAVFVRTTLKHIPWGVSLLVVASIVAWPTFLTYLDHFGADSFIVVAGLPTLAIFWAALHSGMPPDNRRLFLSGAGIGLCLAIKLSFVPVAAALLLASWLHVWMHARSTHGVEQGLMLRILPFIVMPAGALVLFLVATSPIIGRLPEVVFQASHQEVSYLGNLYELGKTLNSFAQIAPPYFWMLMTGAGFLTYLLVKRPHAHPAGGQIVHGGPYEDSGRFDYLAGGIFVLLMLLAVIFMTTHLREYKGVADPGVVLRQLSPSVLGFPFLLLLCYSLVRFKWPSIHIEAMPFQVIFSIAGLVIVVWGITTYISYRQDVIQQTRSSQIAITDRLPEITIPGTRAALWEGGGKSGEAMFHFWGNYWYGNDEFAQVLLRKFPRYTEFRLIEFRDLLFDERREDSTLSRKDQEEKCYADSLDFIVNPLLRGWRRVFPSVQRNQTYDIVTGESLGVQVSIFAYRASDRTGELRGVDESEVLALLKKRFGAARSWEESVGGTDWVFISVSEQGWLSQLRD